MNPFKPGDKVYHIRHGAGIAVQSSHQGTDYQWVQFSEIGIQDCHIGNLSFSPWPAPNHTRPFEPVLKRGDIVIVRPTMRPGKTIVIEVLCEDEHVVQVITGSYSKRLNTFHHIGQSVQFN